MDSDLTTIQLAPLNQRPSVLESFMSRRVGVHKAKDKVLGKKWTNEVSAKTRSKEPDHISGLINSPGVDPKVRDNLSKAAVEF